MACEKSTFTGSTTSTGITPVEIFRYTPTTDATVDLDIKCISREIDASTSALWNKRACIKNQSGTTNLVSSVVDVITARKDAGASTWVITGSIDGTDVVLTGTGGLGQSIQWLVCAEALEFLTG